VTFGSNLVQFATTPSRFGWRWDAFVQPKLIDPTQIAQKIQTSASAGTVVQGFYGELVTQQHTVPMIALGHGEPGSSVEIISGRAPLAADEVALGRSTLRLLHSDVGGLIEAETPLGGRTLRVVGVGVFARFTSYQASEPTGLGVGAAVTLEGLTYLGQSSDDGGPFFLVSDGFADASDRERLGRQLFAGDDSRGVVRGVQRPVDVRGYAEMRRMPLVLVAVLGVLVLAALAHGLTSSTRQRRRDLAVLGAIGFTPGQLQRTVLVQTAVISIIGSVIAAPIGVLSGRWAWHSTARWLGISETTEYPAIQLVALLCAVAALSMTIAVVIGRHVVKGSLASTLMAE